MSQATPPATTPQVQPLLRPFGMSEQPLPFVPFFDTPRLAAIVDEELPAERDSLYSPTFTLAVFVSQCLCPDGTCRAAVARIIAWLVANGRRACSANSGPYCRARAWLPLKLFQRLVRLLGREPRHDLPESAKWLGHPVKVVDGSTVSMPDTKSLQAAFPQQNQQKTGVGFPIARIVVVFCFAYGTVLDAAMGKYQGKATGENKLFRSLDCIEPNDVILGDRFYGSFWELALLDQKKAFGVFRVNASRRIDFRKGTRLGKNDHLVVWLKPKKIPSGMDAATYAALPEGIVVREVKFQVEQKGFRTKEVVVVTTLVDAEKYTVKALAALYYRRWDVELNIRSLKVLLGIDVLRCKSAEMVEKEFWARLLAYNVVRSVMAATANAHRLRPEQLSFQGARQLLRELSASVAGATQSVREELWLALLRAVAQHRVGDRPGRVEPRARKRRPKSYPLLQTSRAEARKRLLK